MKICVVWLTSFHDLSINIGLETVLQSVLSLDITLDSRERLQALRDVLTLFRLDLLHKLSAVEGANSLLLVA